MEAILNEYVDEIGITKIILGYKKEMEMYDKQKELKDKAIKEINKTEYTIINENCSIRNFQDEKIIYTKENYIYDEEMAYFVILRVLKGKKGQSLMEFKKTSYHYGLCDFLPRLIRIFRLSG